MKIGPFEILSTLGSGGSGIVYKARHDVLGRVVALKQLNRQVKEGDRIFERFTREAQLMASIRSDHVVILYSYQLVEGRPLLEMEYCEGGSLEELMAQGPIELPAALQIIRDVLRGLKALHGAGVVHRDVKPANVLRDNAGRYKLTDFGLSATESEIKTTFEAATIRWVAPESVGAAPRFDFRSDLYSVGMIAYEAILGPDGFHAAFPDLTPVAAFGEKWLGWLKDAAKDATPLHGLRPEVPGPVSLFVARLMSKDPDRRFGSADAALEALEPILDLAATSAPAPGEERRREHVHASRRPAAAAAAAPNAAKEPAARPAKRTSSTLRYAGVGLGSLAAAIGAVLLGAYLKPRQAARPRPQPAETSAPAPTNAATEAPRLVAAVVDPQGTVLTDVEVTLRPGDLRATANASGDYVVDGLSAQTYELTASKQGYEVMVKSVAVKPGGPPEMITLRPQGGAVASPASPPAKPTTVVAEARPGTTPVTSPKPRPRPEPVPCPENPNRARDLFYCPEEAQPNAVANVAGLHFRILRALDGGREQTVVSEAMFRSGDRVRFAFESNIDGYLYVVQQGSSGRWTTLFPTPQMNGGLNAIRAFEQYFVPSTGYFLFDQTPGTERIFVFLSKTPVEDLPGTDKPVTRVETLAQARIDQLQRRVRTRDLVLEEASAAPTAGSGEDTSGTYVVNRDELADAVIGTFELIHR